MEPTQTPTEMSAEQALHYANEGLDSQDHNRVLQSLQIFEQFLDADPENHDLLFAISCCLMRLGKRPLAYHICKYVTGQRPTFAEAQNNLGFILQTWGKHEEARACFHRALEIDGTQGPYYNNIATAYVNEGNPSECLEWTTRALERDPDNPEARWNAGLANLELGRWKEGWAGYEYGLANRAQSSQNRKQRHYAEGVENLVKWGKDELPKEVAVYGEQGVGDEILASQVLPEAATTYSLVYEAHPRLVNIMRHNFNHLFPIYGTRKTPASEIAFPKWHSIEAKAPIFTLLGMHRQRHEDFPRRPYLKPFDNLVDKHRERLLKLGDRPRIGISWKGGTDTTRRDLRSIRIEQLIPLFMAVDAAWVSLQYDPADRMGWNTGIVAKFEQDTGLVLNHEPDIVNDLDECYAGLIHALDLVISINNSLVHACGAFGVPCWTLTPAKPAWRYNVAGSGLPCGDERMIWYGDHVRQIRQAPEESWDDVIARVAAELPGYIERRDAA